MLKQYFDEIVSACPHASTYWLMEASSTTDPIRVHCWVDEESETLRALVARARNSGDRRMPDVTIGRLRGGFCVSWPDPDTGKRRRYQLTARSRKEAEAEALDVYKRRTWKAGGVSVLDCWSAYRDSLRGRPNGRTLGYTGKAVLEHFGHLRPDLITRESCLAYAAARSRAGISTGSVHTELGHLRSSLRYAEKSRMIDRAPYIWRPEKPTPKERYLERAEIIGLLDNAGAPHIKTAIILLLGTAGRVGAVLDLTWERVDFDRGTINLRRSDSKTRKGRAVVPMNGMTRAELLTAKEAALTDYVVEFASGPVKSIRKGFSNACERAGLKEVTLHTLRHTAAVYMAEAGIPMSKISQYLGHSNTATTERVYARFAPSHMQDAADVLNFTEIRKATR